ncbi:TATA box-binding protein-associated factor RNA polymerase I subunit B isoform X1 [Ornithorhynchus anatinus]|uniref:TATA box-binding protein-associated factor RNA polymerase I subunit B isoform X1 n=1 Tax=Ornithorhynchus anatinus TaxID=9258 RepID=UPI0010A7FB57|nr:TATA box-binding protein-associated factor RNA polymerase I subunit B isoform X1 [Ornithorhynchus anatinus]
MDEEETRDYNEPCTQCAAVTWGITEEGKYYCKSCLNVIEKSKELVTSETFTPKTKIQAISRGIRKKRKFEKGWEWYICEGFQYILLQQAEALLALGVCPELKDDVLYNFWRRYLQKSNQAYCKDSKRANMRNSIASDSEAFSDWDSEADLFSEPSVLSSKSEAEAPPEVSISQLLSNEKDMIAETASICSGSVDGVYYSRQKKKGMVKMTLPVTLAFCYMSLLWQRETITLSDLLRLVEDGHIPYMNAFLNFPEEMKLYGCDIKIFVIESWPTYESIYSRMIKLATFLDLPRFPDITENSFLHPNILCMKYLMEANLPDELHDWTCQIVKITNIGDVNFLTFDPIAKIAKTVKYDVQAVAIIVIVLKILFLLDDKFEWSLSRIASKRNEENKTDKPCFDFRKWYNLMKKTIDEKQKKREEAKARHLWKSEKPLYYSAKEKATVYKRKQMIMNLQKQFSTLANSTPRAEKNSPSSFQFNWTKDNAEVPCFHGHSLEVVLKEKDKSLVTVNSLYWLSTQKFCRSLCDHVTVYEDSNFSRSYQFVLNIFSYLLRIKASLLHEEVSLIERRLFNKKFEKRRTTP